MAGREFSVSAPVGDDVFRLAGLTGFERLSRPFEFELDLVSEDDDVAFADVLGQPLSVRMRLDDGASSDAERARWFSGHVARFARVGRDASLTRYRVTLRPWLWLLTRASDCRIFQNRSVPDIVKAVFREHGFTDFEEALERTYAPREYCVQYRESDFDFVSRLLEDEGIAYYFTHADGKHTLVLADGPSAHGRVPGYETIEYRPGSVVAAAVECAVRWRVEHEVRSGACALSDFDFAKPRASLGVVSSRPQRHSHDGLEVFEYPGGYVERSVGEAYAATRIEELQTGAERGRGRVTARGLYAGATFELTESGLAEHEREWLIIEARYRISADRFESTIETIDARQPFRPRRVTPKPGVQGPQTAIVVGKSGEEIWTDRFGRIKVQFHWDRAGRADESSSCWVRVAHSAAGKRWGGIAIPRIGQEVVVEFLEGDPDRPLVTGCVYNADCMPPHPLPREAHASGFRSHSTKGGGGFNELRFEDVKGKERVYLHAQHDHRVEVGRDESAAVGRDRAVEVKRDDAVKIGRKLIVDAKDEIVFRCGRSSISMKKDGTVSISGMKIRLDGRSKVDVKSNGQVVVTGGAKVALQSNGQFQARGQMTRIQGTMLDLKGKGIASLKGALTKIG